MRRFLAMTALTILAVLSLSAVAWAQTTDPGSQIDGSAPCHVKSGGVSACVKVEGASSTGNQMPFTGSASATPLTAIGASLVLSGGVLVFVGYRRRTAHA
jgi:LPXTG-motif cell wall-anchored protein